MSFKVCEGSVFKTLCAAIQRSYEGLLLSESKVKSVTKLNLISDTLLMIFTF